MGSLGVLPEVVWWRLMKTSSSKRHVTSSQPQEEVSGPHPAKGGVYMANTQRERTCSPSRFHLPLPVSLTSCLKKTTQNQNPKVLL